MDFHVTHQQKHSQGELLLRSFFGFIYIIIPHGILLMLLGIGAFFHKIISFLSCLFTGKFPKSSFDYLVKYDRYNMRVSLRMMNLLDGYPTFGLNGADDKFTLDFPYPEKVSQGKVLLRMFLGFFMIIPHAFILYFRMIGVMFINIAAWFSILFSGKYPEGMFNFVVETLRWQTRVNAYFSLFTDTYPPFSGKVLPGENTNVKQDKANIAGIID